MNKQFFAVWENFVILLARVSTSLTNEFFSKVDTNAFQHYSVPWSLAKYLFLPGYALINSRIKFEVWSNENFKVIKINIRYTQYTHSIVVQLKTWFCWEKMSMNCVVFCNLSDNQSRHRSCRIGTNQIYIQCDILIRMVWCCVHLFF